MKCLLCGMELNQATTCQVCGERVVSVVGNMTEDLQKNCLTQPGINEQGCLAARLLV